MSIYDFKMKDAQGNMVDLADYKDKVLLIVNTATGCGFTPQYEGLENLYKKYQDQGFEILDFPCNQFLEQAPGSDEEIVSFCKLNYGTSFKQFSKVDVNGENASDLFQYLKAEKPADKENAEMDEFKKVLEGLNEVREGSDIKWNFTKFLVDRQGNVVERYAPSITPEELEADIKNLI